MIKINIADHDYANRERRRENPPLGCVALLGCGRIQAFTLGFCCLVEQLDDDGNFVLHTCLIIVKMALFGRCSCFNAR